MELDAAQNSTESPAIRERRVHAAGWVIGGGFCGLLGSLLPFLTSAQPDVYQVSPGLKDGVAFWAVVVAALGALMLIRAGAMTRIAGITAIIIAGLFGLGLLLLTAAGIVGFNSTDAYGDIIRINLTPGIGIFLAILGFTAAGIGGIFSLHTR